MLLIVYLKTLTQDCTFLCGAAAAGQKPLGCVTGQLFSIGDDYLLPEASFEGFSQAPNSM